MPTLENKITRLERLSSTDPMTLILWFITPGHFNPQCNYLEGDGQEWQRQPGESEQDFTDRASHEVKRNEWGVAQLTASEVRHAID